MTDYGVTDDGFQLKRTSDIISDLNSSFSISFPGIKTDGESVAGQLIGVFGAALGQVWEAIQAANNQYDPSAARGANLSSLVLLNGITRKQAQASTVELTITGTPSTVVAAGSLVSNEDGSIVMSLDSDYIIDGGGTVAAQATATETGPMEIVAGDITTIVTPISGWDSVTNAGAGATGRDIETDTELRVRQVRATFTPSMSIVDSIFANINSVVNVSFCRVYVNETSTIDSRGIPGHSIAVVVVGGDQDEIAAQIFSHLPAGILTHGGTAVSVSDTQGFTYQIKFTRPISVPIFVNLEIYTDSTFPLDGIDQIKQAIIDYAQGGSDALGWNSGDLDGFPPGVSVALSRLYTPINSVKGHWVKRLRIGPAAGFVSARDFVINWNCVAEFTAENITISIAG